MNTRFQQHLDVLLTELGLWAYRKLPNPLAEAFGEYGARDYFGVLEEYEARARSGDGCSQR